MAVGIDIGVDHVNITRVEGDTPRFELLEIVVGEGLPAGKAEIDQCRASLAGAQEIEGDLQGVRIVGTMAGRYQG